MRYLLLATSILFAHSCFAHSHTFKLTGHINQDTGTIELIPDLPSDYYPNPQIIKTQIQNGQFEFSGTLSQSLPYVLRSGTTYLSGTFYIDSGAQSVFCNTDSLRVTPQISNNSTNELLQYRQYFSSHFSDVNNWKREWASMKKQFKGNTLPAVVERKNDSALEAQRARYLHLVSSYLKTKPNSVVVIPAIANMLDFYGYTPVAQDAFDLLPVVLKHSDAGKVLSRKLKNAQLTAVGHRLPLLSLKDTLLHSITFDAAQSKATYTLVDFWYSHCPPCVGQFPVLLKLYNNYSRTQLNIVGISTDKSAFIGDWKRIISDKQLPWPQYLDENSIHAKEFGFIYFPTNLLLDDHSVILRRNIPMDELEQLLAK